MYDLSQGRTGRVTVICTSCRAKHLYDLIHQEGNKGTIALEVNSDPIPHSVITIIKREESTGPAIREYRSTDLLGIILLDEDEGEIDRFLTNIQDHD